MPSFKPETRVTVQFDPLHISRMSSNLWVPSPRNSIFVTRSEPDENNYPRGGIADMLSPGALALTVAPDRSLSLSGMSQEPSRYSQTSSIDPPPLLPGGFDFRKRALNDQEFEALRRFQGYPVQLRVSTFLETDVNVNTGVRTSWSFAVNEDTPVIRSVILIGAWIGLASAGTTEMPLVDSAGEPMLWPASIVGDALAVDTGATPAQIADLPPHASATPSQFGSSFTAQRGGLNRNPLGLTFVTLFQNRAGQDNSAAVNAVSSVKAITSPGRVDSDGFQQPFTNPPAPATGPLPLIDPILNLQRPNYTDSYGALIVSSDIIPELIEEVTGTVVERSRHTLLLEVSDRTKAGFALTPSEYNSSVFPDLMIEGRGFFIIDMQETQTETIMLTVSTRPGG